MNQKKLSDLIPRLKIKWEGKQRAPASPPPLPRALKTARKIISGKCEGRNAGGGRAGRRRGPDADKGTPCTLSLGFGIRSPWQDNMTVQGCAGPRGGHAGVTRLKEKRRGGRRDGKKEGHPVSSLFISGRRKMSGMLWRDKKPVQSPRFCTFFSLPEFHKMAAASQETPLVTAMAAGSLGLQRGHQCGTT